MPDTPRKRLVRRRKTSCWSGRGEIYGWLRAHHKQIKELKVGKEKPWCELLDDLREDFAGTEIVHVVSLKNVTNTWKRVCRDLGDDPPENRFKNYPSRISKDWKPSGFREPSPATASPTASLPGTLMRSPPPKGPGMSIMEKLTGQPDLIRKEPVERAERDVDAEIADLRQQMRKRAV